MKVFFQINQLSFIQLMWLKELMMGVHLLCSSSTYKVIIFIQSPTKTNWFAILRCAIVPCAGRDLYCITGSPVIAMVYCINLLSTYLLVHLPLPSLRPFGRVSHPLRHTARPIYHFHCAKTNIIKMGKIKALFGQIVDIFLQNYKKLVLVLPQHFHFGIDLSLNL